MQCGRAVHKPNMVSVLSAAFVLFAVSTLAVHGLDVPTGGPIIPPECHGKTYCDIMGADYPQHQINQILARNLSIIHRMKRAVNDMPKLEPGNSQGDGNCETETEVTTPFYLHDEEGLPKIIAQSQFFTQTIPQVKCKRIREANCFKGLIRDGSNIIANCVQKTITAKIYVYSYVMEKKGMDVVPIDTEIDIDCVCVIV